MAKAKAAATTEVATAAATALAAAGYESFEGQGFENQTSDDYTIPFLQILQGLSPQLEQDDTLKIGMILNSVTGEISQGKEGVPFIPATTTHLYIEWKPRDAGGGFVAIHEVNSPMVVDCVANQPFGVFKTPGGNDLIETFSVYGIALGEDGSPSQAVVAFSGTKIKKYKAWMTQAKTIQIVLEGGRRIQAPLFAHRYRLKTVGEKNNKGSFANWDINWDGENAMACRLDPTSELVEAAVSIRNLLETGKARAAFESQSPDAGGGEAAGADGEKPKF